MKICQIRQPAGIGDIFFTQKIAHHYVDKYYKEIWPVRSDLLWIHDYLISPGDIEKDKVQLPDSGMPIVALQFL